MAALPHELMCPECIRHKGNTLFQELVAINGVHVSKLRKPIKSMLKRSRKIAEELYVLRVKTFRDKCALRILNMEAKIEAFSFRNLPREEIETFLLISTVKLLGYLAWNRIGCGDKPVLRQLYIVEAERRKGLASKLIQCFVKDNCRQEEKVMFVAESPNEASLQLFVKLGFAKKEGNNIIGVRMGFISCG